MKDEPFLYYKSRQEIQAFRRKPVTLKLQWLEAQMEFFHNAMPARAKRIRDRMKKGKL